MASLSPTTIACLGDLETLRKNLESSFQSYLINEQKSEKNTTAIYQELVEKIRDYANKDVELKFTPTFYKKKITTVGVSTVEFLSPTTY